MSVLHPAAPYLCYIRPRHVCSAAGRAISGYSRPRHVCVAADGMLPGCRLTNTAKIALDIEQVRNYNTNNSSDWLSKVYQNTGALSTLIHTILSKKRDISAKYAKRKMCKVTGLWIAVSSIYNSSCGKIPTPCYPCKIKEFSHLIHRLIQLSIDCEW